MLFNSITYLIFFVVVFVAYWFLLRKNFRLQNLFLLVSSYFFYGWWDVRFLILIFITSVVDFFIGRAIFYQSEKRKKRLLLWVCMIINLGMLGFFKYYNFFIDSFTVLLTMLGFQPNVHSLQVILPVGISFYTFQSLSYSFDLYKGRITPTKEIVPFLAFVSFFPQLVAGPIERAAHLLPQFLKQRTADYKQLTSGLRFILYGLFKKVVIADRLAYFVDLAYNSHEKVGGTGLLIATFMFGIQIYCDFSGYSDIAIGSARLLGFDLMQNFRSPYLAKSFREFWHRWHISLSGWFRDYVYIPLGGNRVSEGRWIFNILVTFTLSGLWHGASLTFVIWGFVHGIFLVSERILPQLIPFSKRISWAGLLVTFVLVNLSWIFFRAQSFDQSIQIIMQIVRPDAGFFQRWWDYFTVDNKFREFSISVLAAFPVFLLFEIITAKSDFDTIVQQKSVVTRWLIYILFVLMILFFGVLNAAPQFIYFQF